MNRILLTVLVLFPMSTLSAQAGEKPLGIAELRQLYESLLSGKTLVTVTKTDDIFIAKERKFYKSVDTDDGGFEVPIETSVIRLKDGKVIETTAIKILDRVQDLGGIPIIYEEVRLTEVEEPGSEPREKVEFSGLFRVSRNDRGGFVVESFGLMPTVSLDNGTSSPAGSMASFSCFPVEGKTRCVLTIRDYKLGEYKSLVGYTLGEPIGTDYTEISDEISSNR